MDYVKRFLLAMLTIDDYDIGQSIGRGGFATVHCARNRRTQEVVAIKKSERSSDADPNLEWRLQNELVIHSKMKHPNVVSMLGCDNDDHFVYIVLELCSGGTLFQYLQRHGPLSEALAVHVIQQLISALEYIHSQGVVHRDLKLSNILLTGDLQDPTTVVKICDFGLAVRKEHPDEEHFTLCGTPNYIAPEIASHKAHGYPADIWSVGCLFYSMVVGSPPFEQEAVKETLQRITTGIYDEPDKETMSEHGKNFLRCLLELNPAKRANIRDLLLHPLLSPVHSAAPSPFGEHFSTFSEESARNDHSVEEFCVGRRSNPTRAAWDEDGSSDTVRVDSTGCAQTLSHAARVVTKLRDVLVEESDSYSLSEKLAHRPAQQHHHQRNNSGKTRQHTSSMQMYENPSESQRNVVAMEALQREKAQLEQKLLSVQTDMDRAMLLTGAGEGPNVSYTTASTALVSYPHTHALVSVARKPEVRSHTHSTTHTLDTSHARTIQIQHLRQQQNAPQSQRLSSQPAHSHGSPLQRPTHSDSEPTQSIRATISSSAVSPARPAGVRNTTAMAAKQINPITPQSPAAVPSKNQILTPYTQSSTPRSPEVKANSSVLSTSFLHGVTFDLNKSESSWARNSRSWLDSIGEIRSSVSAGSTGDPLSPQRIVRSARSLYLDSPSLASTEPVQSSKLAHHERSVSADPAYKEWSTQHAYERFVSGAAAGSRGASSPHSVGSNLSGKVSNSVSPVATVVEAPASCVDVLKSAQCDMCCLKPFCLTSTRHELLLLTTDQHMLFFFEADKLMPDNSTQKQHIRLILTPTDPRSVRIGHINSAMRSEINEMCAVVASGRVHSAKSQVMDDLNSSYTDDGRAAAQGSEGSLGGLKYHHCFSAQELQVFDVSGTKAVEIDTGDESIPSTAPAFVSTMLQRVFSLLLSAKSRMPKQIVYFSTHIAEVRDSRASNPRASAPVDTSKKANCKCMMMSNDPFPDFYLQWEDGAKLRYELRTGRLHIQKPQVIAGQKTTKALKWSGVLNMHTSSTEKSGILPEFAPYAAVAQRALAKCLSEWSTSGAAIPKVYSLD